MQTMRFFLCALFKVSDFYESFVKDAVGGVTLHQFVKDSYVSYVCTPDIGHRCGLQHIEDHVFGRRLQIIWEGPNGIALISIDGFGNRDE